MLDDVLRPAGPVLERFTRDLTAEARAGRLDPVRCRADEIARLIDILLRHGKNNAALVGPAGVGKTAIVEGFAQRVAAGGVPLALRDVRVLALDHVSLLAGTTYRGQYEERIRGLVGSARRRPTSCCSSTSCTTSSAAARRRASRWTPGTCSSPHSCAATFA